eukprot:1142707-Pelagomonas_calceolata.AAC.13
MVTNIHDALRKPCAWLQVQQSMITAMPSHCYTAIPTAVPLIAMLSAAGATIRDHCHASPLLRCHAGLFPLPCLLTTLRRAAGATIRDHCHATPLLHCHAVLPEPHSMITAK